MAPSAAINDSFSLLYSRKKYCIENRVDGILKCNCMHTQIRYIGPSGEMKSHIKCCLFFKDKNLKQNQLEINF